MIKPKEFFVLGDIALQLSKKQIKNLKSIIYVTKEADKGSRRRETN